MVLFNNGNSLFTIVFRFGWQTNWLSASEQLLRPVLVKKQLVGGRKCDFFKKCLRGRLVCCLRSVGILVMFTAIFVSAFFVGHNVRHWAIIGL